ncbi:hypothetical protein [Brevibacterium aurantiacum]|uniref:Uncharacterized protein n=1 Tax=Brevibacterium aurantiacum TaxID=273384 RepID=A0A1D7W6C4_BREAU|nr:hypothetical protein [Brevibacterium aurantiacum]AOP54603.1 hypothetical protein BLSMQ_2897 [Brevibacterium aurantiacum]
MTIRDRYLDALALMQAHASDDREGLETILANADSSTLLASISDLALLTGSRAMGTPGDPSSYLAHMRAEIMGLRDE